MWGSIQARRPWIAGDDVILGSARNLPFADGSFDLTTSFDVLQHLAPGGDRRAAAEMLRVLRPGGIAVLRTNGRGLWPAPNRVRGPTGSRNCGT